MSHSTKSTELLNVADAAADTQDLSDVPFRELPIRALQLANNPAKTQALCQVLKEMKSRRLDFDWQDQKGNTLFHRLASTPGHDWALLRQTFEQVLPIKWERKHREAPSTDGLKPSSLLETAKHAVTSWVRSVIEPVRSSILPTAFEQKNPVDYTPLAVALVAQNLPFAQIAWDYNNQLFTPSKDSNTGQEMQTWLQGFMHCDSDAQGKACIDWLMSALKHECGKTDLEHSFIPFLNQALEEGSTQKWLGYFIVHCAEFGELKKLMLFDSIVKHGYVMTAADTEKCQGYRDKIKDFTLLCAHEDGLTTQVKALASTLVGLYLEALESWITVKLREEAKAGYFTSTPVEPAKWAEVEKLRAQIVPFFTAEFQETWQAFGTAIAALEESLITNNAPDQQKIQTWLEAERMARQPVLTFEHADSELQEVLRPSLTSAADLARCGRDASGTMGTLKAGFSPKPH